MLAVMEGVKLAITLFWPPTFLMCRYAFKN